MPEAHLDLSLPHNIEAEQSVLGAILLRGADVLDHLTFLAATDFYEPAHQRFFVDMQGLRAQQRPITPMVMKTIYGDREIADGLTINDYLRRLVAGTVGVIDEITVPLAREIVRMSRLRLVVQAGADAALLSNDSDVDAAIDDLQARLDSIRGADAQRSAVGLREAIDQALRLAEAASKSRGGVTGIPTGLGALNRRLGGFHGPDLIIAAGRPGMGKSALAMTAAQACAKANKTAAFYTLEMGASQLGARLIAEASGISADRQRRGQIGVHDFDALAAGARRIEGLPIIIDHGPRTLQELLSAARKLHRAGNLGLIVVDYLQLLVTAGKADNRVQEVSQISRGLKSLAVELDVPVLALSQLSRNVESRDDKRPQLSDLRESGSIEQDADIVLFLYREAYYEDQKRPKQKNGEPDDVFNQRRGDWERGYAQIAHLAEVITAKNRHGPTGVDTVAFDAETTSFRDLIHG